MSLSYIETRVKKMEVTILLGLSWVLTTILLELFMVVIGDDRKENGNYDSILGVILGFYRDNGNENGNSYRALGLRFIGFMVRI